MTSPSRDEAARRREDDAVTDALFRRYAATQDRGVREQLVLRHGWLARKCARRFVERGEPLADLVQVAQIGVVKAVDRFDPTLGNQFSSFATPTVMGELRRHFRDTTWSVSVPRRSKELFTSLNATIEQMGQQLCRPPRVDEVAQAMGLTIDTVLETMEASQSYRTSSLDQPTMTETDSIRGAHDRLGDDDDDLESADVRVDALDAIGLLDERSRMIVVWRFYEGCTQSEIGERLGIGQVQVSRLLRAALLHLRARLGQAGPGDVSTPPTDVHRSHALSGGRDRRSPGD